MCVQQVWYVGHVYSNLVLKCIFFSTPDRHLWRPDQGTETCLAWLSSLVQQEASSQTWQTEAQFVGNTWKWRECSDQSSQGPWALHEGPGCEGWTPLRPNHSESSSCHYCKDGKGRDTRGGLGNSPGSDLGRLESQCRGEGWEDLSSHSRWVIGGQVKDKECRWGTQEKDFPSDSLSSLLLLTSLLSYAVLLAHEPQAFRNLAFAELRGTWDRLECLIQGPVKGRGPLSAPTPSPKPASEAALFPQLQMCQCQLTQVTCIFASGRAGDNTGSRLGMAEVGPGERVLPCPSADPGGHQLSPAPASK